MKLVFYSEAWEDYVWWSRNDRRKLEQINKLITAIMREPHDGIGKPEPLRGDLSGFWSRRVDQKNRIVYAVDLEREELHILMVRGHYDT